MLNEPPVCLITGASSGIGEAAAELFARRGYRVALAARRVDRLEALAERIGPAQALVVPTDVSDSQAVEAMVQQVLETWGRVDVLVNNVGFGRLRRLENLDPLRDIEAQVRINLLGAMWAARAVLPHMYQRGSGSIVNVSSVAGWVALPGYSVYAATKYALRGFTEALRREAAPRGVRVSAVYPGPVATEFSQHIGTSGSGSVPIPSWIILSAEQSAEAIYRLATGRKRGKIIPAWFTVLVWLNSHFPALLDWQPRRSAARRRRHR